jgi:hypothetical protein
MIVTSSAIMVGVSCFGSTTGVRGAAERISVAMDAAESLGLIVCATSSGFSGAGVGSPGGVNVTSGGSGAGGA